MLLLALLLSQNDISECADEYSDCHDNCSLRFGVTTRETDRAKLGNCMQKCKNAESACRDRYLETKNNGLEKGAVQKDKHDDDLREDNRKKPTVPEDPPPRARSSDDPPPKKKDPPPPPVEKRTATRVSDLEPQKKEEPKKEEPKPAPGAQTSKPDPDVRAEDEKPPPKKRADPPKESKKKEKALDEWDPDAP